MKSVRPLRPYAAVAPLALVAATALLLSACGGSSPSAATGGSTPTPTSAHGPQEGGSGQNARTPGVFGVVAQISGKTLQVQSTSAQTAVTYTASTRFTATVATTRSAVKVGSCVVVRSGTTTDAGSAPARRLGLRRVGEPDGPPDAEQQRGRDHRAGHQRLGRSVPRRVRWWRVRWWRVRWWRVRWWPSRRQRRRVDRWQRDPAQWRAYGRWQRRGWQRRGGQRPPVLRRPDDGGQGDRRLRVRLHGGGGELRRPARGCDLEPDGDSQHHDPPRLGHDVCGHEVHRDEVRDVPILVGRQVCVRPRSQ